MRVWEPPFPLALPQVMDAIEGLPLADLETLSVYVEQLRSERLPKRHGFRWETEARLLCELGVFVPNIEERTAAQLHRLRQEYVRASGLQLEVLLARAVPLTEELQRLNIRATAAGEQ